MTTAKEILEAAGLQDTFWGQRIIASEELGWAVDDSYKLAHYWTDCACGKQDQRIPRYGGGGGRPQDVRLADFGMEFSRCWGNVASRVLNIPDERFDMPRAAQLLVVIEERAKEILAVQP